MATAGQCRLIRELMAELGWDRRDLARRYGEDFREWEGLDADLASELIDNLIGERRREERDLRRCREDGLR